MHAENSDLGSGFHFGGLLLPDKTGDKSPSHIVLLLDPTPARMATALELARAGWLPVSCNTSRAYCLDLALLALSLPSFSPGFPADTPTFEEEEDEIEALIEPTKPAVIVMEANHPLITSSLSPDPFASPFHHSYHSSYSLSGGEELNLSAKELAGRIATLGLSPLEIPFILYTASTKALLTTPTRWPTNLSKHQASEMTEEENAHGSSEHATSESGYFSLAVERKPSAATVSTDISHQSSANQGQEDPLLAVMAYLTGIHLCRNCHKLIAPEEPAHLAFTLQLWCGECSALAQDATSFPPVLRLLRQAGPSSTSDHSSHKPLPEHYRPPLFPARLLAKAAFTLVTGSLVPNPDPHDFEDPDSDPWNAA
ncbi:MAG TPA: hypothetical protein VH186_32250 [Chloroflexia bacterium]|nr:hypothetical protein [Chloroflexia bacterium]